MNTTAGAVRTSAGSSVGATCKPTQTATKTQTMYATAKIITVPVGAAAGERSPMEVTFDIADLIPVGHDNAVTRQELVMLTGFGDRQIRDMIAKARRDTPILNMQDGKGYYKPDMNDPVDLAETNRFCEQETRRLKSIGWSLRGARQALKGKE